MKSSKKSLFLAVIFILLFIFIPACAPTEKTEKETSQSSKEEQSLSSSSDSQGEKAPLVSSDLKKEPLVIHLAGRDAGYPNPYKHSFRGPGIYKMELIYDSLMEKDEKGEIPWLAKSWTQNEEGTEITFTLEDSIKWHDGKPFTPEDVQFTFDYFAKHPPIRNFIFEKGEPFVKSVEVKGENQVVFHLKSYNPTYLSRIGTTRIIPKHVWESVEDPLKFEGEGSIVGCGPYKFVSYNPEQGSYKFEAFKDYWGKKQRVDIIEWIPVSDKTLAFENGEIDLTKLNPDVVSRFEGKEDYKISKIHGHHSYRLYLNMEKVPAFKDKSVRQAMAYGIDRMALVKKPERGSATVTPMSYLLDSHRDYNPDHKVYEYNLEKAKKLMGTKKIKVEMITSNSPKEIKIAELIKLDLAKINIDLTVKSSDRKTRDGAVKKKNYEMALMNYGGMGGDTSLLQKIYGSYNGNKGGMIPGYQNKKLDGYFEELGKAKDENLRRDIAFKIQDEIAEEAPLIMLQGSIDNNIYRISKYDGWRIRFDHTKPEHVKLSYLEK